MRNIVCQNNSKKKRVLSSNGSAATKRIPVYFLTFCDIGDVVRYSRLLEDEVRKSDASIKPNEVAVIDQKDLLAMGTGDLRNIIENLVNSRELEHYFSNHGKPQN